MENGCTYRLRRAKKGLKGGEDRDGEEGGEAGGRKHEGRKEKRRFEKDDLLTPLQIHAESVMVKKAGFD